MRKNIIPLIVIGIIVISILYFLQSNQVETTEKTPAPSLRPEQMFDEKGPKVGINMTLSPVFINIIMNPGETAQTKFKVTNNNPFPEDVKLALLKFKADSSGSKPVPIEITKDDEFVKGIKFSEADFILEPNKQKTINLTFTSPKNADLGYYFAVSVIRSRDRKPNVKETLVAGAPSIPVLVEVRNPNAKKEAEMVNFKTSSPWYEYLPVQFEASIKNTGNIHLTPFGDIFIDTGKEKMIGSFSANESRGNILPGTVRTYKSEWNDGFIVRVPKKDGEKYITDKKGNVVYETKWDFSKINMLRMGKYNATAIMVYNDGERDVPLEAKTSFWVIPWKIMLGVAVVIFLLFQGIKSSLQSIGSSGKGRK